LDTIINLAKTLAPFLVLAGFVLALLAAFNVYLKKRWSDQPEAQFKFQLIMLCLSLAGVLVLVAALPISETLRGQFLSLIGILLSAAIALASTTFIGNIMAGIMLKAIRKAKPGDFITVESLTGRITEMDLLHTEIQTEFRDLVTVPNSYMVSNPLKVVRASGSIITGEVSLGYDVAHGTARKILRAAAEASGLTDCFVHVRELGDFAVTYRVAGLLEDIHSLISARSRLLEAMLDALHGAGIEIVSPNYMNTRSLGSDRKVIARPSTAREDKTRTDVEALAFDKADDAASIEKLRRAIKTVESELDALAKEEGDHGQAIEKAKRKQQHLQGLLKEAESSVKADSGDEDANADELT